MLAAPAMGLPLAMTQMLYSYNLNNLVFIKDDDENLLVAQWQTHHPHFKRIGGVAGRHNSSMDEFHLLLCLPVAGWSGIRLDCSLLNTHIQGAKRSVIAIWTLRR